MQRASFLQESTLVPCRRYTTCYVACDRFFYHLTTATTFSRDYLQHMPLDQLRCAQPSQTSCVTVLQASR